MAHLHAPRLVCLHASSWSLSSSSPSFPPKPANPEHHLRMSSVSRQTSGGHAPPRPLIATHHQLYVGGLLAVVVTFTALSLVFQSHVYNVSLARLPSASSVPPLKPVGSVFARKSNLINRIFIKKAWLWTTLAHLAQLLTLRAPPSQEAKIASSRARGKRKADNDASSVEGGPEDQEATVASPFAKSLLRWAIATVCWLCVSASPLNVSCAPPADSTHALLYHTQLLRRLAVRPAPDEPYPHLLRRCLRTPQ